MLRDFLLVYLFLAVLLTAHCATFVMPWSKGGYRKRFSFVCFAVALYIFAYLLQIVSDRLEDKLFWNVISYIGMAYAAALWCSTVVLYVKRDMFLSKKLSVAFFSLPLLTVLFRLNDSWLHFVFRGFSLRESHGLLFLAMEKGPWYLVHVIYDASLILLTLVILAMQIKKTKGVERKRYLLLFAATTLPVLGAMPGFLFWNGLSVNLSALSMPLALYLILWAIAKYEFIEVKTLVRDSVFESNKDCMMLLDLDGRVLDLNKSAVDFFNSLGIPVRYIALKEMLDTRQDLLEVFESEKNKNFKINIDGQMKHFEVSSGTMRSPTGQPLGVLKTIWDVSEERKQFEKVSIQAGTDELTGILNRREFLKQADTEFDRCLRYDNKFCVLMLDLDHFKVVNDTWGHAAGDEVLKKLGELMLSQFRKSDIVGRIGGEEFAVVLSGADVAQAKLVAEKFRREVEDMSVFWQDTEIKVTISIGAAEFRKKYDNFQEIMLHADEALYESKTWGRNRTSIFAG